MISPAAAELIRRAKEQVRTGIQCVLRGELALAEVWFRAATASLEALHALLDGPAQKPIRKMALVVMPRDEEAELPEWMTKKHGGNDGDAA
jgi:hypothetical protein